MAHPTTPTPTLTAAAAVAAPRDTSRGQFVLRPTFSPLDKIIIYETKQKFIIVGSNQSETRFRVLKVDRSDPYDMDIMEDLSGTYDRYSIQQLLGTINESMRHHGGLQKTVSAFGVLGFIRFLEGYYMILITKRRRVALIGAHYVYKIEETTMLSICHPSVRLQRHPDEIRYLKTFQNVDLSSNFYYSYTYDLTHTLQFNMMTYTRERYADSGAETAGQEDDATAASSTDAPAASSAKASASTSQPRKSTPTTTDAKSSATSPPSTPPGAEPAFTSFKDRFPIEAPSFMHDLFSASSDDATFSSSSESESDNDDDDYLDHSSADESENPKAPRGSSSQEMTASSDLNKAQGDAAPTKSEPDSSAAPSDPQPAPSKPSIPPPPPMPPFNDMFVWNHHLLQQLQRHASRDWILPIIHGFIAQSSIYVYGHQVYVTLIARRSRHFAGTRFLKRGANEHGMVANDVESEQITFDTTTLAHDSGKFTSFVQMRGSIPLFWSQDNSGMIPKPPITIDRADPFCSAAALHFDSLFKRYGTPVVVLNLVKRKEKKPRESILHKEFGDCIQYLNQFLPNKHKIVYKAWDMAKHAKSKKSQQNVIERLEVIASHIINTTGFFHAGPQLHCNAMKPDLCCVAGGRPYHEKFIGRLQQGVVRVNCIDCLDRTNAVEFMMGKSALARQLYALGVIKKPKLKFDSDVVRLLTEMYEDHGDTIALQYGGSQLVNTMETYRKISPWTSHSRDILHTIHRYYSNSFTDVDKQGAINLFLGTFVPHAARPSLWEIQSDYYLHYHDPAGGYWMPSWRYRHWWSKSSLPIGWSEKRLQQRRKRKEDIFFLDQQDDELLAARMAAKSNIQRADRLQCMLDYYNPSVLTSYDDLYAHHINSTRLLHKTHPADPSPFKVRAAQPKQSMGLNLGVKRWIGYEKEEEQMPRVVENVSQRVLKKKVKNAAPAIDSSPAALEKRFGLTSVEGKYGRMFEEPTVADCGTYERFVRLREDPSVLTTPTVREARNDGVEPRVGLHTTSVAGLSNLLIDYPTAFTMIAPSDVALYTQTASIAHAGPLAPSKESRALYDTYEQTMVL
ncbi:sac domain-containing inositol phosphatase 3 [Capsaspora owczarzaki ATCC 30864]|nr:sac domain-containing inositol phosphatase 3 [Capsaspora owczarzaki ATCC 30864]|eukprot:XP_004348141.1 sac domain-containing inositol phosphatase 3 [Capsaspora owczarzaki ATCC 30864]